MDIGYRETDAILSQEGQKYPKVDSKPLNFTHLYLLCIDPPTFDIKWPQFRQGNRPFAI